MDDIVGVLVSWQVLLIGVLVWIWMTLLMKAGEAMWKIKNKRLRQSLLFLETAAPWLPPLFGLLLGALPWWPIPGDLHVTIVQGRFIMLGLGLGAGYFYERIWKGIRQVIEARGIDLNMDISPKEQKKQRPR